MTDTIKIEVAGEAAQRVLAAALAENGFDGRCAVADGGTDGAILSIAGVRFERPVRLGVVLDALRRALQEADSGPQILQFGPFSLDRIHCTLSDGDGVCVRLTEKETSILAALHGADGQPMGRAALLEAVWGYGAAIETHTLETHIYRLRQKIEADAAAPLYLLTEDDGYKLIRSI